MEDLRKDEGLKILSTFVEKNWEKNDMEDNLEI